MRRTLTVLALTTIVAAALLPSGVAAKKAPKTRKVETPYTEPAIGTAGAGVCLQGSSCVFVEPAAGEKTVTVEIEDDLGTPVYATVIQDTSGDGNYLAADDETVHICGATEEPLPIEPQTVSVWVWQGPGPLALCPGAASSGVVTTTFSK